MDPASFSWPAGPIYLTESLSSDTCGVTMEWVKEGEQGGELWSLSIVLSLSAGKMD